MRGMPHKNAEPSLEWLTEELALYETFGLHQADFGKGGMYEDLPFVVFQDALLFADERAKAKHRASQPPTAPRMGRRSG